MKRVKTSKKGESKTFTQITKLNKTAMMKKSQNSGLESEFKLFPDAKAILNFIENEHYPTISSISRAFKMHKITASEIVHKLKKQGWVLIEPVGTAKIIKIAKE